MRSRKGQGSGYPRPVGSPSSAGTAGSGPPQAERKQLRNVLIASLVGNTLESYDYFLYGTAAALIFGRIFFAKGQSPLAATLMSLAVYSVGYLSRPLGGLVAGHFGDRLGRKVVLLWTMLIMGVATVAIGLLPTYAEIGLMAPILLLSMRLLQGIAAGGEWGGGVLIITERAAPAQRGFLGSLSQMGMGIGFTLSFLAFLAVQQASGPQFLTWGWRVPFLFGFLICAVGIFIRLRLPESREFEEVRKRGATVSIPLATLFRTQGKTAIACIVARVGENGPSQMIQTFSLAYGAWRGVSTGTLLLGLTIGMLTNTVLIPLFGRLSDKVGRHSVYLAGAVGLALFSLPFFLAIDSGSTPLVVGAFAAANVLLAAMYSVQPALFSETFPTELRYTGLAVSHEVSIMIASIAPVMATGLLLYTKSGKGVAALMGVFCLISAAAIIYLWRTKSTGRGRPLSEGHPAASQAARLS